ncbi:hypothetical protein PMKS-001261 [Pichia membranifaciens]|uniref:Uncharacterized protein n=1 Tax=Pichia membranifaciens TaxID=4926 RepID=A0A1Q2YEI0_9ASCO|nr:hypothetical protein PMKS-001261 [Pichia membranifaciens]
MQWNNSYLQQDPLDPLFLNDDENPSLSLNLNFNLNEYNLDASTSSFKAIIDNDLNSNIISTTNDNISSFISSENDFDNTSPLSSTSSNSATTTIDPLQEEFLQMDSLASYKYNYNSSLNNSNSNSHTSVNYLNFEQNDLPINNSLTINTTELRKSFGSPQKNNNVLSSASTAYGSLQNSPILKSQNFKFMNLNPTPSSLDSLDAFKLNDLVQVDLQKVYSIEETAAPLEGRESREITEPTKYNPVTQIPSTASTTADNEEEDDDEDDDDDDDDETRSKAAPGSKAKKISDSRLSLAQLSIVLNLEGNDDETAKREKNILKILREDLDFPIGEKTWIRDTPVDERERLMTELTGKVEQVHGYGYSKKTLSIIVRRASYYMMQGRLRRERRLQRKRKSMAHKKALLESSIDTSAD